MDRELSHSRLSFWALGVAGLIMIVALAGCTSGSSSNATASADESTSADALTLTTARPGSQTASDVFLPMHAPDTRTGVDDVDSIISAMTSGAPEPLMDRVKFEQNSCGPERPAPRCGDGQTPGTLVESVSVQECAHYYLRQDDVAAFISKKLEPGNPFAVYRDTSGLRQLVFDRATDGGVVSRVSLTDDGQIVGLAISCSSGDDHEPRRFDMLDEAQTIYPYAPDRFILPPPK